MSCNTVIECGNCEAKVQAKLIAKREFPPGDEYDPYVVYFLECPICHSLMLGEADYVQVDYDEWDYDSPKRIWPNKDRQIDWQIPILVRKSLNESQKCYKAKAFSACVVMCGKSLEALCKEHKVKNWQLSKGLKELKDKGIIDGRLYEWSESLREKRNIGAHASEEDISREDASDLLSFTFAICEYVYVLTRQYEEFKDREAKRKKR